MAAISTLSSVHSIFRPANRAIICRPSISLHTPNLSFASHGFSGSFRRFTVECEQPQRLKQVRAVEEDTSIPEQENGVEAEESSISPSEQPPVTVPVSPSDILTMFFQAEGALNETAIPSVTEALEGMEGISNLKVQVVEGIAFVELTKQTTIQSTGVASSLVETIQGAGFKLQTLNLSFEDKEEILV